MPDPGLWCPAPGAARQLEGSGTIDSIGVPPWCLEQAQVTWSDAEVITQRGTSFVGDAQRPPAADGNNPPAGQEMAMQGRTDRASQMRPALGEVKARQHQRPATGPGAG